MSSLYFIGCYVTDANCLNCPTEITCGESFAKECLNNNQAPIIVTCLENGMLASNDLCQPGRRSNILLWLL